MEEVDKKIPPQKWSEHAEVINRNFKEVERQLEDLQTGSSRWKEIGQE